MIQDNHLSTGFFFFDFVNISISRSKYGTPMAGGNIDAVMKFLFTGERILPFAKIGRRPTRGRVDRGTRCHLVSLVFKKLGQSIEIPIDTLGFLRNALCFFQTRIKGWIYGIHLLVVVSCSATDSELSQDFG